MNNDIFQLVEHTNRNIFLTGKAGTGKTTFLNHFVKKTRKNFIILAPTGIAAINAGGVTIHSMFGLPLRTFIPTLERINENLGNNIGDLLSHFRYRREKLKLLREVEIIIIDEVSMLRADVLDMMDFALKHIRRNSQKFGGIQMLFIGDLYQLPPVVRDENFLLQYYSSPFFFSAKSLENTELITVELTKVYRQTDENFVKILNGIRDSTLSAQQLNTLNQRYEPNFEPKKKSYVYLTSHNQQAESINEKKLEELSGKIHQYQAQIIGDFGENLYPVEKNLQLKVGAQVMFVRNDPSAEKKYYNGKLAEIIRLNDDEIVVHIENSKEEYKLKKEIWENKYYTLDENNQIVEEVLGSFEQYPIRLAWAVTIHKSQGLTFDRVIVDAGRSFASGQVYVALSRCRTLEGIVLKSKISPSIIFNDKRVESFQKSTYANEKLHEIYEKEKYNYSTNKHLLTLDPNWIAIELKKWFSIAKNSKKIDLLVTNSIYNSMSHDFATLQKVYQKYSLFLQNKIRKIQEHNIDNWQEIIQKAKGSVAYFFEQVEQNIYTPLRQFYQQTKDNKDLKEHNIELKKTIDDLQTYLEKLQQSELIGQKLFEKKKDLKKEPILKIPTQLITWKLFSEEHKTIEQIAKQRGMTNSTIIGHLAKYAENGTMTEEHIQTIVGIEKKKTFEEKYPNPQADGTLTFWKNILPTDFEYGEIRLLLAFFQKEKNTDPV